MRVLVAASTFAANDGDPVPAFVRDQIIALQDIRPDLKVSVLAPHDKRSGTKSFTRHDAYDEYRFHYFWPFSYERLAGRGIMPALKANPLNYFLIPFFFLGEFIALHRLTRRIKPDVLYAHWFTPQGIVCRWVGFFTGTPFVFTTHASDVDVWHKIPLVGRTVVRGNIKKSRAFTAVSKRSMTKLQSFFSADEWKILQKRSAIIPMGVNLPTTADSSAEHTKRVKKTIVFIGRLVEKKGVQYLLPAFKELLLRNKDTHLTIGGDGPMLTSLRKQVESLGISGAVTFSGYVTGTAKKELLSSADVYIVPSIIADDGDTEGLPVSLLEGLAYGKICIATNESGGDDILTNGKSGFLIPQKDTLAIVETLERALSLDDSSRVKMSAQAQEVAKNFSWQKIAERYYSFLLKD